MAKVEFVPLGKSVEIKPGETIFDAASRAGVIFADGCDGTSCRGNCRVRILNGISVIGAPTSLEKEIMAKYQFQKDERVACLTFPRGNIQITTSYW